MRELEAVDVRNKELVLVGAELAALLGPGVDVDDGENRIDSKLRPR